MSFSGHSAQASLHLGQDFALSQLWPAAVEGWCGRIFKSELDALRNILSSELCRDCKGKVDPGGYAATGNDIAVTLYAGLGNPGAERSQQIAPCPMCRCSAIAKEACSAENQRACADRGQIGRLTSE